MKPALAFLALALVVLALAVSACFNGKEPETLDDYLDLLEEYIADSRGFVDRLQADYDDAVAQADDGQARLEALQTYFSGFSEHQQDVVAQLEDMDPPDNAKGQHEDLLAARKDGRDIVGELNQSIQDAGSETEADAAGQEFETDLQRISDEIAEACRALQDLADENDVDVDLGCDTESG
jgi:hypothetical protein